MIRLFARGASPVLALVVSACSGPPGPAGATVADSAGVQIVTHLPGSLERVEAWTLSPDPVLEIGGGASPDVPLLQVTGVTPLSGGAVAVGMNMPPQGLVFGSDGSLIATLGGPGDGPGEFSGVGSILAIGDSIGVWDPDRRRLSVFGRDGRLVRETDLSDVTPASVVSAPGASYDSGITRLMPLTDGSLVAFGEGVVSADTEDGVTRPALPSSRLASGGTVLSRYGTFPGMTVFSPGGLPLPFGARTHATTVGETFVVGIAAEPEVRVFRPDGSLARIVRWPDEDRTVGGPFLDRWTRMLEERPEFAAFVEPLPRPERFPAYEGLVATDTGEFLVGAYAGPLGVWPLRRADPKPQGMDPEIRVPAKRWVAFGADGGLNASVVTPEGFLPYAVRGDRMWGVYTDELDVESIRAYRLNR